MTQPHGMSDDPGAPENTDPEVQSADPDRVEQAAAEAADAQGADEDDDLLTTGPDPVVDVEENEFDPVREADLNDDDVEAALSDIDAELGDEPAAGETGEAGGNDLEAQLAERTEDLQRVSAEYANYRRRTERERQGIADSAKASVVTKLLPVLDDLDLAEQHGDLEADGPLKSFANKFRSSLQEQKLEPFGVEGEAFDPEAHEAVQDLSSGDEKVIGTVLRKGYRVGDRMIRTAMVIIADPVEN
ncbi:nucleotide exchange factor GrpE [Corynebacterium halotolerans]|uniref:nucleotide exchange factor GrpE n=1 Tax=Corynebacterium halotolerans TaxID=225326 RepID=UPI003CF14F42